jgi:hypothetical protein
LRKIPVGGVPKNWVTFKQSKLSKKQ